MSKTKKESFKRTNREVMEITLNGVAQLLANIETLSSNQIILDKKIDKLLESGDINKPKIIMGDSK